MRCARIGIRQRSSGVLLYGNEGPKAKRIVRVGVGTQKVLGGSPTKGTYLMSEETKLPEGTGFGLVLEPVDRQEIETLCEELKRQNSSFGIKEDKPPFEENPKMRVVVAGPGLMTAHGFIENHIRVGDIVTCNMSRRYLAKSFNDPGQCWMFNGSKYIVHTSRYVDDVNSPTYFIHERAEKKP
jgi:hypothetical protein